MQYKVVIFNKNKGEQTFQPVNEYPYVDEGFLWMDLGDIKYQIASDVIGEYAVFEIKEPAIPATPEIPVQTPIDESTPTVETASNENIQQ